MLTSMWIDGEEVLVNEHGDIGVEPVPAEVRERWCGSGRVQVPQSMSGWTFAAAAEWLRRTRRLPEPSRAAVARIAAEIWFAADREQQRRLMDLARMPERSIRCVGLLSLNLPEGAVMLRRKYDEIDQEALRVITEERSVMRRRSLFRPEQLDQS